jgi:hypothetical protein
MQDGAGLWWKGGRSLRRVPSDRLARPRVLAVPHGSTCLHHHQTYSFDSDLQHGFLQHTTLLALIQVTEDLLAPTKPDCPQPRPVPWQA